MAQLAIILGNGFDIDLGLPSKFSDFAKSQEFRKLVTKANKLYYEEERGESLILQLEQASAEYDWFDIEGEIHKYVVEHTHLDDRMLGLVRSEFEELKKALRAYLLRISGSFKSDETKLAYKLLLSTVHCPLSIIEIYFNYTYAHSFLEMPLYYNPGACRVTFVHGSLKDNDIVLGCDLQEGEKVNRQLSFMYKYNQLNKANHVARNILEAKEIIFFGHSINEMDFCYFKEFFKVASASPNPIRHLTIITYDDESERAIKDNIRNQGISVSDLYSNLWTFDFIHTSKIYAEDKEEIRKWDDMLQRLLAEDRHGL